jgi:hypothetical protein
LTVPAYKEGVRRGATLAPLHTATQRFATLRGTAHRNATVGSPQRCRGSDSVNPPELSLELADWRAGRNAIYQLAALTIGTRLAVADA